MLSHQAILADISMPHVHVVILTLAVLYMSILAENHNHHRLMPAQVTRF